MYLLLALSAFLHIALALQLEMGFGERKCIAESIPSNTRVKGDFRVSAGQGDMQIGLTVRGQQGQIYYNQPSLSAHKFEFRTPHYGSRDETFNFCLYHQPPHGTRADSRLRRKISFAIDYGMRAEEADKLVKTKHVDDVHSKIARLDGQVDDILRVMDILRANENEISMRNQDTNQRVLWYSLCACLLMLCVGTFQMHHFKSFFKQRKMF